MKDWWIRYLGQPWNAKPSPPDSYTCGELVRSVYRDLFGLDSPEIVADPNDWRDVIGAMSHERFPLRPLTAGEAPREFDTVFMARVRLSDHVGIAVQTTEGLLVLHCMQQAGAVLDSIGQLAGRGFRRLSWFRHLKLEQFHA